MLSCLLTRGVKTAYPPQSHQPIACRSAFFLSLANFSSSFRLSLKFRSPSLRALSFSLQRTYHTVRDGLNTSLQCVLLKAQHVSCNYFLQWLAWHQPSVGIGWINKWGNKRILFWIRSQDTQALVANLLLRSLRTLNKYLNSLDCIFHTQTYIAGIL